MSNRFLFYFLIVTASLFSQHGYGQEAFEPYMVKDLVTKGQSSSISDQIIVGGRLFFTVTTNDHGRELWITDGTAEGTAMVKDIRPGPESSEISRLCDVDGILYFSADDGEHGKELWKSDGTLEGTVMVRDFSLGPLSSEIRAIVSFKGMAFFQRGRETPSGYLAQLELYRSDGTAEGTTIVKDINPNYDYRFNPPLPLGSEPGAFLVGGDYLYFRADDGVHGRALWRTDGTEEGTILIEEPWISPELGVVAQNSNWGIYKNGYFFFGANDTEHGFGLWKTSGTPDNTFFVRTISEDPADYFDRVTFHPLADGFLFIKDRELWSSDGTANGTVLIRQGAFFSRSATLLNDQLIFSARDLVANQKWGIWTSDGTEAGTYIVKEFDSYNHAPGYYAVMEDVAIFRSPEGTIWISDGTQQGTVMLFDPPFSSPIPPQDGFRVLGGKAFFMMDDGIHGKELWTTSKTTNSHSMVSDISTGTEGANIGDMYSIGDVLYFTADTIVDTNGNRPQLWKSDGTATGTSLIWPGEVRQFKGIDDQLYFIVYANNKSQLYRSLGTPDSTSLIWEDSGIRLSSLKRAKEMIFFTASDENAYDPESGLYGRMSIHVTDAEHDNTRLLHEVYGTSLIGDSFTEFDGKVFFAGKDREHGMELWITDGTANGTKLFLDLDPSYSFDYPSSSNPRGFTVYRDLLFFGATVKGYGDELWISDGTIEGTSLVVDLWPGLCEHWSGVLKDCSSGPTNFHVVNKKLFFTAQNELYDVFWNPLLWTSDGTPQGTVAVDSSEVDTLLVRPFNDTIVSFNDELFFSGLDFSITPLGLIIYRANQCNYYGVELWRTDGTDAGTRLVEDIVPCTVGWGSAEPHRLFVADDLLFFKALDGEDNGLWMTDGKGAEAIKLGVDRTARGYANGRVFFENSDGIHGNELWALRTKIFISGCNTEVTDRKYGGRYISNWIEECAESANGNGDFVSCVSHLTNDIRKDGLITGRDAGAIQSCAVANSNL